MLGASRWLEARAAPGSAAEATPPARSSAAACRVVVVIMESSLRLLMRGSFRAVNGISLRIDQGEHACRASGADAGRVLHVRGDGGLFAAVDVDGEELAL